MPRRTFVADDGTTPECPCCIGGLDSIKRDLGRISHLMSRQTAAPLGQPVQDIICELRDTGRTLLGGLADPRWTESRRSAMSGFDKGVDRLHGAIAGAAEPAGAIASELAVAMACLARDLRALFDGADEILHPAFSQPTHRHAD